MTADLPKDSDSTDSKERDIQKWYDRTVFVVGVAVLLLVALIMFATVLRIIDLWDGEDTVITITLVSSQEDIDAAVGGDAQPVEEAAADVEQAIHEVETTTEHFNLLLSLLEGAGVLVGLAIGAAAFYGLRNSRETREEFKEISKDAKEQLAQLRKYDEYLKQLPAQAATVEKLKVEQAALLDNLQSNFLDLFQAYQELGLRNYREAYDAAKRVLARDATNPQALYIAGWLEFQYVEADLDDGILHLEQALKQVPTWPSAKAALGVLLRRKGLRASTENERAMYMVQAEAQLREALNGLNFDLIDPNMESFWGPLGGALRDSGRYEEAITAYENACQVTPGSSYPRGNLAALYLMKVQAGEMSEKRALDTFRETRNLARVELSQVPNDYFLMMDIAMASAILGHEQAGEFETAQKWLDQALDLPGVTPELRSVSIRGWGYLRDYCPTEWDPVLDFIYKAIQRLEEE